MAIADPPSSAEMLSRILGELILRMVWSAVALRCVKAPDFIGFYKIYSKKYEAKNGLEIRCAGNST